MKKVLFIIMFLAFYNVKAQDIIVKKDGTSIKVKIQKIGVDEIDYLKYDKLDGPNYSISKKEVVVVYFEDGSTEIINQSSGDKKYISLEETKEILVEYFGKHAFSPNTNDKKGYVVSFEEDFIRLSEMSRSGEKVKQSDVFDFSKVYMFGEIDKRKKEVAFLNIWVPILKNKKKDKWDKYKLVIRVKGHNNAELMNDALKHYMQLVLEKNGTPNMFNNN